MSAIPVVACSNSIQVGIPIDNVTVPSAQVAYAPQAVPQRQLAHLESQGMPDGINKQILKSCDDFALRIWVIDNSGSMATNDGKRVISTPRGERIIESSRWAELGDSLNWHAAVAANLDAPIEMRLLNPPSGGVPQVLEIGRGDVQGDIAAVSRLVATSPTGRTPLCEQIRQVVQKVAGMAPMLRETGKRVVVVIASDGAATDGNVEAAMRPLQGLPVWVVVRLCTDDERVVDYWNKVDEELELDMDVLDDLGGEAQEVCQHNGWLTYGAPLHRLREFGCAHKVFDLLDEKALGPAEMQQLVELVFGPAAHDLPHPQLDYNGFEDGLVNLLGSKHVARPVWDPRTKKLSPWVNVSRLRRTYAKGNGCCIM